MKTVLTILLASTIWCGCSYFNETQCERDMAKTVRYGSPQAIDAYWKCSDTTCTYHWKQK